MSITERLINDGPFGGIGVLKASDLNTIRAELIELHRLRAATEALKQVDVTGLGRDDRDVELRCNRCGIWYATLDAYSALAELVQRAGEHAEVCR